MSQIKQNVLSIYAKDTLKSFGTFLETHDNKLQSLLDQQQTISHRIELTSNSLAPIIEITYLDQTKSTGGNGKDVEKELMINKALTTLANLCTQCRDLSHSAKEIQTKFLLTDAQIDNVQFTSSSSSSNGSSTTNSNSNSNERILYRMSCAIDFFCQVYFLLNRIIVLLQTLWRQIVAITSDNKDSHVHTLFEYMSELLERIVVFNEIVQQSVLPTNWTLYKKWIRTLSKSPGINEYCSNIEHNGIHSSIEEIELMISDNIFRKFLDSLQDVKKHLNLKDINNITQHSNNYIRKKIMDIEQQHNLNEAKHFEHPNDIVRLTAFMAVLYELGIQIDTKSCKMIVDIITKYQRLPLYMTIFWSPQQFLAKHCKNHFGKIPEKSNNDHHHHQVSHVYHVYHEKSNLLDQKNCRQLCTQITLWSIQMHGIYNSSDITDQLKKYSKLIVMGLKCTNQVNSLIDGLINRHVALMIPITQATITIVSKLLQYLQQLHYIFTRNYSIFIRCVSSLVQWQKQKILQLLYTTKKQILNLKLLQHKMNILSTLKFTERSVQSSCNMNKCQSIIQLAFEEFVENERNAILPMDKQKSIKSILMQADQLSYFQKNLLQQFENINIIYTYYTLLLTHLKELSEQQQQQQQNPYTLQNIITATHQLDKLISVFQCHEIINNNNNNNKTSKVKISIYDMISKRICNDLELFLRVEALSHLFLNRVEPFQATTIDYRNCINITPTEIDGSYNILKDKLENYFTATFYNLTTIAPHDWKSYEKMRHFGSKIFSLRPVDDYLPNQIIDQGIDVLQIMRNIHTFASTYSYNMNLQLFVENQSKGNHLDIIGIRHVANSVQTHGTGILNTTVNFIYQFLRQKLYTFSTFLHDEHIKSRLLKEFRYYTEHKQHSNEKYESYPYERAESLLKKIRKLGVSNTGETYMDLFRKVITQIGNAVGYVRLLQSGSKSANYRSRSHMARCENSFMSKSNDNSYDETTKNSLKEYEKNIGHMMENSSDSINYFKLLMQGFQLFLCNENNQHLKLFYLITPALISNYIDYRVKEKMNIYKKDQAKCSLFDDGFPMALIYLLNMLNQLNEFHELGWNATVGQKLNTDRMKVRQLIAKPTTSTSSSSSSSTSTSKKSVNEQNVDEKLLQTVAITERHITAYENEYNLLYDSLGSAEIFFL